MTTMPSISAVIPTYKASPFIRETLASVFAQTRLPDEVILADDCSPDDTVAVVEEIARTAPVPVRMIRLEKNSGGPAMPLNAGIDAASGDLIATLDHDDRMTPNRLADQVAAFAARPDVGLVVGRAQVVAGDTGVRARSATRSWEVLQRLASTQLGSSTYFVSADETRRAILRYGSFLPTCSLFLFPKLVWQQANGFDPTNRTACDLAFLEAVSRKYGIVYQDREVVNWEERERTLTTSVSRAAQIADGLRVLTRITRDAFGPELADEWRTLLRQELSSAAYELRSLGWYRRSAQTYLRSVRLTGFHRQAVPQVAKVAAAALLSLTKLGGRGCKERVPRSA